ncbi:hypothetical protein NT6N_15190 [Oceaniferula spumae]|uniref:Uncharacterized protein n=1 Tax=Oceaniferula spumae TaxID=2979115 RepID=A0AAT9FKI2_9BACT
MGLVCTANAGISVYVDGDGYDSNNKDWQSNTVDDIDRNGLGTDGYIFFGNFDGIGNNQTYTGGPGGDITLISSEHVTDVLPSYVSAATMGADCNGKIGSFPAYEALDNPLIGDGTDGICGNIVVDGDEALNFTVSGLPAGNIIRVGIVTVLNDNARGRFDTPVISLTDGTSTVSSTNLPNLSSNANGDGPGWVFFDIDSDGDYTVLIPNGSATDNGAIGATPVNGLGGITFDSFTPPAGSGLLVSPGELSLDLDAPDTSIDTIIKATYYAGQSSSNDVQILSLAVDSGFTATVVDNSLGLTDKYEDIQVTYNNSEVGLTHGQSATATLEVTWTEVGSGVNNTTNIPLQVTYRAALIGYVNTEVTEENWYHFDFDGNSTFTSADPSGYNVDIADGSDEQIFPAEIQQFTTGFDISQVGQKITAEFDVVMNSGVAPFDKDFRFGVFDTSKNVQVISMNDLGPVSGSFMNIKIGNSISFDNGDGENFVPNDYATLAVLYGSALSSNTGNKTNGLIQNEMNHFKYSIERISETELYLEIVWSDSVSTSICATIIDETSTASGVAEYLPAGGYESFDGFGFQIHERYSAADYTVSNFNLTYTVPLRTGFEFQIASTERASSGDVTLTLSNPVVGASYLVRASDDLVDWDEVGTYVVDATGVIVLPAAATSAYVNDDEGFFQVKIIATDPE